MEILLNEIHAKLGLLSLRLDLDLQTLILAGVGLGSLVIFWGLTGIFAGPDRARQRMRSVGGALAQSGASGGLVRSPDRAPTGLMKALVPAEAELRTDIARQLAQAGVRGHRAVANFYLLRFFFGLILPALLVGLFALREHIPLPARVDTFMAGMTRLQILQVLAILVALGFYGPQYWLKRQVRKRQEAIESGFPNALDLLQISVEAGLGFDAAMTRVAQELHSASPEIAEEFMLVQREVLAGRDRERALLDMATRMGVEEATSFANVVLQSMQFGTSISEALATYANEMRQRRELKAQEKANKLPVQMSGAMSVLMLPALLMITLGPVVIRYIRYFSEG